MLNIPYSRTNDMTCVAIDIERNTHTPTHNHIHTHTSTHTRSHLTNPESPDIILSKLCSVLAIRSSDARQYEIGWS